jgi:Fe-S-cluster-containing dehydrogenase component
MKIKTNISKFFVAKNAGKIYEDKLSPNGEYRLTVTAYATKKGCWSYTQGLVYKVGVDRSLFEVQRNYSSFPHSWIEHPNGHQYLVCGADYQGQTVLELDTGKRKDFVPLEAKKGVGFCWTAHCFDESSKILTVCGCVWACPYEFRFYDFSNPMNGWPEITIENDCIDEDSKWPIFEPNGIVKTYCTKTYDDDDDDDTSNKPEILRATKTLVRDGLKFKLLNEEVSEEEKIKRKKQEEYWQKYKKEMDHFKSTDPLYLASLNLAKDPAFSPEDYYSVGTTHKDWCPHFKTEERRFCRRIINTSKTTIDLEWGMVSGPIKLVIYKKGKHFEDKWFEHSVVGMEEAFKVAKQIK